MPHRAIPARRNALPHWTRPAGKASAARPGDPRPLPRRRRRPTCPPAMRHQRCRARRRLEQDPGSRRPRSQPQHPRLPHAEPRRMPERDLPRPLPRRMPHRPRRPRPSHPVPNSQTSDQGTPHPRSGPPHHHPRHVDRSLPPEPAHQYPLPCRKPHRPSHLRPNSPPSHQSPRHPRPASRRSLGAAPPVRHQRGALRRPRASRAHPARRRRAPTRESPPSAATAPASAAGAPDLAPAPPHVPRSAPPQNPALDSSPPPIPAVHSLRPSTPPPHHSRPPAPPPHHSPPPTLDRRPSPVPTPAPDAGPTPAPPPTPTPVAPAPFPSLPSLPQRSAGFVGRARGHVSLRRDTRSESSRSVSSVRADSPEPRMASARARLASSISAMRSSTVPSVIRRWTWTGWVWPMR